MCRAPGAKVPCAGPAATRQAERGMRVVWGWSDDASYGFFYQRTRATQGLRKLRLLAALRDYMRIAPRRLRGRLGRYIRHEQESSGGSF